jgi:hypothetical protein
MSDIREKIKALPDAESLKYGHCSECGYEYVCDSTDLKALLDRLERLEGAARELIEQGESFETWKALREALK